MANQFLGLSLFIMLLSFFIILNAISSFEITKTQPVLNSLSMTFAAKQTTEQIVPGKSKSETTQKREGSALDKLEALFKSQIAGVETKQNRLGTMMFVKMPFKDFQKAMNNTLKAPKTSATGLPTGTSDTMNFMPVLVSLLETQRGVTYTMDMSYLTEAEPSVLLRDNGSLFNTANRSISNIAKQLEQAGLPKFQVSAGLKKGEEGMAHLIFRRYEPFSPLGELEGGDEE